MTIIKREDIPQGVLDEIAQHYEIVTWGNYGAPITENVVTRKTYYNRLVAENVEGTALDPITFETKTIIGTQLESYLVRGIFTDNTCDAYAVISGGLVVRNDI
jgi:hypothetical protein